jgi:LmbE family N-acetylglucosaminyl deacetylase
VKALNKKVFFLFFFFLFSLSLFAQSSNYTILCVAAHPDDEDGATLAYYSLIKGYDASTVFYTRGEGGQNEIGPELYDELGKIRTQECYNAGKIQGSHPYFLGFLDFGFSKTAKETFKFWEGKDSILAKIVYMIRLIRPDVVITNHDTITIKPNRQHGNHQAVGITIFEAFEKAADPNYHTEQLTNGVEPWQIKKLYFREYDTTKTGAVVTINVNQEAPNGKTIDEISFEALSKHRTQGMDKLTRERAPWAFSNRKYILVRSDKEYPYDPDDLFSGIEQTKKTPIGTINSFPTHYYYRVLNAQDSLYLLQALKFSNDIKIGLVRSYDNTLETTMKAFGINFDTLSSNNISNLDLKAYTTILIDIRAYLYRTDLINNNQRILDFVKNGGNVICFYQKPQDWNGNNFAPYPIYITSERVTEEDASVEVLEPSHNIFTKPNQITDTDWLGWVQERNIYLPSGDTALTSPKYHRLLSMSDEDDTVSSTSLLWTEFGAGTYTYCSLALYRQLKIFNEGGLKLFLNLISRPRREVKGKYN